MTRTARRIVTVLFVAAATVGIGASTANASVTWWNHPTAAVK